MIRLSSLIDTFETAFLAKYNNLLLPDHRQALTAMKHCRNELSSRMLMHCADCDQRLFVPHSCGHRFCPHCQHHESEQWVQRQLSKLIPGTYFLLTFTLPASFRPVVFDHQRTCYDAMIRSVWETVRTFSHNDQQLQGTPGAVAVLHTHSRRLEFHPHVHLIMPAAALDAKKRLWRTKSRNRKGQAYLFNHKALAKVFRAKMLDALTLSGLDLPRHQTKAWVVDCKNVGAGDKALVYLGRYLYRGVIREKDILSCEQGRVTFRYQDSKTKRYQTRTLDGAEFLWLLLQHVLPKGFRRTRNFGFLHPNSKRLIQLLRYLLKLAPVWPSVSPKPRPAFPCPGCGSAMSLIQTRLPPPHTGSLSTPVLPEDSAM